MEKGNEIKTVVPALRFSEFITGKHWYISKIKDIYQITRGQVLAVRLVKEIKDDIYIYPVYSSQTQNGGLVGYYKDYLYENAITWTTDGANARDVNYRDGKFYCTNVCGVLLNQKGFSNKCMAEIINSVTRNYVSYVGNPKLMNGVMGDIIISVPPTIEEQQKIADCLSSLDELIEATAQKVEALKEHKKGLIRRLFPTGGKDVPDLRFPEFQGVKKWERKIIQDICNITTGNKNTQDKKENGIYPFFVRSPKVERIDSWSFDGEAILTAGDGVGVGKIFHYYVGKMGVHQRVYLLYNIQCNSKYLYYFFSEFFYERVKKMSAKNSVDSVRKDMISDMPLLLPSFHEQEKIADCLSSLDELIEVTSRKVEILKEHKKGLMQQLFPKI